METSATQRHDKPDANGARRSAAQSGEGEARAPRWARYLRIPLFLAPRDVVRIDEARLKLIKQGRDISRNRFIAEAIRRYLACGDQSKAEARG